MFLEFSILGLSEKGSMIHLLYVTGCGITDYNQQYFFASEVLFIYFFHEKNREKASPGGP